MKRMAEDVSGDIPLLEDTTTDPVVRGLIRDWDAMEDLLHHVLYSGLGWEMGNEGQILFTDPLSTPKVIIPSFLIEIDHSLNYRIMWRTLLGIHRHVNF